MYSRKPFVDFDPTLPTLKSSTIFSKPSIHTYKMFQKPGSTFLPTYSWLRINKNLILHSKSDFAENSNHCCIYKRIDFNSKVYGYKEENRLNMFFEFKSFKREMCKSAMAKHVNYIVTRRSDDRYRCVPKHIILSPLKEEQADKTDRLKDYVSNRDKAEFFHSFI